MHDYEESADDIEASPMRLANPNNDDDVIYF